MQQFIEDIFYAQDRLISLESGSHICWQSSAYVAGKGSMRRSSTDGWQQNVNSGHRQQLWWTFIYHLHTPSKEATPVALCYMIILDGLEQSFLITRKGTPAS